MADIIKIKDLLLRTIIGVNEWERKEKQDLVINMEIYLDLKKAGKTDKIENTIDYKELKREVAQIVENFSPNLLEALAYNVADTCIRKPKVKKVIVEIDKPAALRFSRSVSVQIKREWQTVVVSLGSNVDPEKNIKKALSKIKDIAEIKMLETSNFYQTPAIDKDGEYNPALPAFINGVVRLETFLELPELDEELERIELELGRTEKEPFSPRTIDLDIVFAKDSEGNVTFIHKDIFERDFLFFSVLEVDKDVARFCLHSREKWIEKLKAGIFKKTTLPD